VTTDDAAGPAPLEGLLARWLPSQRWYADKGRPITGVTLTGLERLACDTDGADVWHVIADVTHDDGSVGHYQVPVSVRPEVGPDLESAVIGRVSSPFQGVAHDALRDHAGSAALLATIRAGGAGGLSATMTRADVDGGPGLVIGAEQSNTSVVYGDTLILKVFRRLSPGENPDLEVTRALDAAGCPAVIPPYGWLTGTVEASATTLALLQPFQSSALEGWKLAQASVRDLYAEGDLHADEVGGDFAAESLRLGIATGEVHRTLAEILPRRQASAADVSTTAVRMARRLADAVEQVPELRPFVPRLQDIYQGLARRGRELSLQRIHGDFHLGQVLRLEDRWVLVDFEGEPTRPLVERRALASPLRDVAGMMRSYDYAARSQLGDHPGGSGLVYRATEWADRNRAAFCDGYAEVTGSDPREDPVVLLAFECDKAVYEVLYETRHRPTWVSIPLGSLERLAGG
jgi:maltokinase